MVMMFGDVRVTEEKDTLNVFLDESHVLVSDLREIGVRYIAKKGAYVVGPTYHSRKKAVLDRLNRYKEEYSASKFIVEEGLYGVLKVIQPFENHGFIVMFQTYDPDVKDKLKESVPGVIYMNITKTWHVPETSKEELRDFLEGMKKRS